MNDTILIWQNNELTVVSQQIMFHSTSKPDLSFSYDMLVCEEPTNVYFRILDDKEFQLDEKQIKECAAYAESFIENGDYNVYAYNPNDNNMFVGIMLKSEAISKKLEYRLDERPDTYIASWNGDSWINYKAAITEEGKLIINPSGICNNCVIFLTEDEYAKFPPKEHDYDTWDFVKECWTDKRDMAKLKKEAILSLRNKFDILRWKVNNEFVTAYEQDTWRIQLDEALSYKKDASAYTPYIDTFLSERTDDYKPTKDELVNDIIANHNHYVIAMAKVNAKQWKYIKDIQNASCGYDIDDISKEINEVVGIKL